MSVCVFLCFFSIWVTPSLVLLVYICWVWRECVFAQDLSFFEKNIAEEVFLKISEDFERRWKTSIFSSFFFSIFFSIFLKWTRIDLVEEKAGWSSRENGYFSFSSQTFVWVTCVFFWSESVSIRIPTVFFPIHSFIYVFQQPDVMFERTLFYYSESLLLTQTNYRQGYKTVIKNSRKMKIIKFRSEHSALMGASSFKKDRQSL